MVLLSKLLEMDAALLPSNSNSDDSAEGLTDADKAALQQLHVTLCKVLKYSAQSAAETLRTADRFDSIRSSAAPIESNRIAVRGFTASWHFDWGAVMVHVAECASSYVLMRTASACAKSACAALYFPALHRAGHDLSHALFTAAREGLRLPLGHSLAWLDLPHSSRVALQELRRLHVQHAQPKPRAAAHAHSLALASACDGNFDEESLLLSPFLAHVRTRGTGTRF